MRGRQSFSTFWSVLVRLVSSGNLNRRQPFGFRGPLRPEGRAPPHGRKCFSWEKKLFMCDLVRFGAIWCDLVRFGAFWFVAEQAAWPGYFLVPGFRNIPKDSGFRNIPKDPGFRNIPKDPGFRNIPKDPGFRNNCPVQNLDVSRIWTARGLRNHAEMEWRSAGVLER
jgi:hypothetical protein